MEDPYDALFQAIGRTIYEWAWLESDVAALVFDLSAYKSPAFYEDAGVGRVSMLINANLDLRTNIAIAKSLALDVAGRPDFYQEVCNALNPIANDMRNERNRFAHDIWYVAGSGAVRLKPGTSIKNEPGSGIPRDDLRVERRYADLKEVREFADLIAAQRKKLSELSETVQEMFQLRYPAEE